MLKIAAMVKIQEHAAVEAQSQQAGSILKQAAAVLEQATFGGEGATPAPAAVDTSLLENPAVKAALEQVAESGITV